MNTTTQPTRNPESESNEANEQLSIVKESTSANQCKSKTPCEKCKAAKKAMESESDEDSSEDKPAKKPMYKLGCWRGAFKGTLDF